MKKICSRITTLIQSILLEYSKYYPTKFIKIHYLVRKFFFLSFFVWPFLTLHCTCRVILAPDLPNGCTHTWYDSSEIRDWPNTETSNWQHTTLTRDTHSCLWGGGFGPTIPASEWLQTHALDCRATGLSQTQIWKQNQYYVFSLSKAIPCMCNWGCNDNFSVL